MPEISTYSYNLRELGELLIKQAKISDGKWAVGVNFAITVGNMGQNQKEAKPGAMAVVDTFNLVKVDAGAEPVGLVIDASKL